MPSYASFNDVLSLCMIIAVIALLVGRSQSFASLHFVLSTRKSGAAARRALDSDSLMSKSSLCKIWFVQQSGFDGRFSSAIRFL
jgi:hypothetical protein